MKLTRLQESSIKRKLNQSTSVEDDRTWFSKYKSLYSTVNSFIEDESSAIQNKFAFFEDPFSNDFEKMMDYKQEFEDLSKFKSSLAHFKESRIKRNLNQSQELLDTKQLALAYKVSANLLDLKELGKTTTREKFKDYFGIPYDADQDPDYAHSKNFNPKAVMKLMNESFKTSDIKRSVEMIKLVIGADPGYFFLANKEEIDEFDRLWKKEEYQKALDLLGSASDLNINNIDDIKRFIDSNW